ncbi:Coq4 family protein [Archangium sp.]|jgi:ubiquinone biosynthesis protein COQ4|uniref:Coq4 family protein n=1 Tax=Archangium sp. TaxID=1872627 RepID=UPI002ED7A30B
MSDVVPPPPSLPENASLLTRLRTAWQALEVLKRDASDPVYGPLFNECLDIDVYKSLVRTFSRSEEGRRLLSERPSLRAGDLDLEALEKLPSGTLGRELMRYFQDNNIQPFPTTQPVTTDLQYIGKRVRETHDLFHVVTGYKTDVVGEMELQAFILGNLHLPTAVLILLFSSRDLHKRVPQFDAGEYRRRLWAAFRRGGRSRHFASFPWESHWETPVAQLRQQLCAPAEEWN